MRAGYLPRGQRPDSPSIRSITVMLRCDEGDGDTMLPLSRLPLVRRHSLTLSAFSTPFPYGLSDRVGMSLRISKVPRRRLATTTAEKHRTRQARRGRGCAGACPAVTLTQIYCVLGRWNYASVLTCKYTSFYVSFESPCLSWVRVRSASSTRLPCLPVPRPTR